MSAGSPFTPEDHKANAALLGAAPDLLAACEAAMEELEPTGSRVQCMKSAQEARDAVVQALRAAIAKARGEAEVKP